MGQVIRKLNRKGQFIGFYVRYTDGDGKRKAIATKAATAADARRILVELEAQAARRALGMPERKQPIRGSELIRRWLDEAETRATDRRAWERRQRAALARALPMLDSFINPSDASRIVRKLLDHLAVGSVRLITSKLKSAWRWAVDNGLADSNPWSRVKLPRTDQKIEYLTRADVTKLLEATPTGDVRGIAIRLAVFAGLRVSEVFGLRWGCIDFDRGTLTVKHGFGNAPTKTRRERVIPLASQLTEVLTAWKQATHDRQAPVCPSVRGDAMRKRPDIRDLYRKAGLHVPSAPWHVLRHTFASHFLMSGGSLLTLQRLLGHSSVAITQVYAHLSDEHVSGEMKRLRF